MNKTNNNTEKKSPFFTQKRKVLASIICGIFCIVFAILWLVFPMPFYSLFFADSSIIGSNILLLILSVIITFPANLLFGKIIKADINVIAHLIINAIGMISCIYLYSIFRYNAVYFLIIGLAVHIAASVILFLKSTHTQVKLTKSEAPSRIKLILNDAVCCILSDCVYCLLFTLITRIAFSL